MMNITVDDKGFNVLSNLIAAIPAEVRKTMAEEMQHKEARKQFQRVFSLLSQWDRRQHERTFEIVPQVYAKWLADAKELIHPSTRTWGQEGGGDYENAVVFNHPDTDATKKAIQRLVRRAIGMGMYGLSPQEHSWVLV